MRFRRPQSPLQWAPVVLNLTPSELREWAARCAAEADNPANTARREQLLNMRDALLGLAESQSEHVPRPGDGSAARPAHIPSGIEASELSAEQCADFADQCRKLADAAASDDHRTGLLGMAQKWDELRLARMRP